MPLFVNRCYSLLVAVSACVSLARCALAPEREAVRFSNGAVVLVGTLSLPRSGGPHPAVLVLHGSGPDGRQNTYYDFLTRAFLRQGIAVLVYDKRGVGASSGDWGHSPFSALTDDAVAALRFLRRHPGIDSSRVGLWGGSEGAVLAPEVAVRVQGTAFVVMQSATGVPFAEQNLYQTERQVRSWTQSEDVVIEALAFQRLKHTFARTGSGWDAYAASLAASRMTEWADLGGPTSPDDWWWAWYRTKMDYSCLPWIERLRAPLLAVWGEQDLLVPVAESRTAVARAAARASNPDVTLRVVEGADHSLQVERQLVALDMTADWVADQVRDRK